MKRRSRSLDLGAIALLVFSMVFVSAVGFAQNTNSGEIRGTVTDPSGATVSKVWEWK